MAPPNRRVVEVWIGNTDGKDIVEGVENRPDDAQLKGVKKDGTPNISDGVLNIFRKVESNEKVSKEWRAKLGEMLFHDMRKRYEGHQATDRQREILDKDQGYFLAEFPRHYVLYSHRRMAEPRTNKETATSKERTDYYLYGHPLGPKFRYRSPVEFYPHLLWLGTDETKDHGNCTCKHCGATEKDWKEYDKTLGDLWPNLPRNLRDEILQDYALNGREIPEAFKKKSKKQIRQGDTSLQQSVVTTTQPFSNGNSAIRTSPMVVVPKRSKGKEVTLASEKRFPSGLAPHLLPPTPLAAPKNAEQALDAQCNKFLYRPGELVWFSRGSAWGLAVITDRVLFKDQRHQDRPEYTVQPLSHPYNHPGSLTISNEAESLRPWLAWSAPEPTHKQLQVLASGYDRVDWKAVLGGHYGPGDAEVDGSIFAAKDIDSSFTPINPIGNITPAGEIYYTGVYSGGEKIWVGEPVRLRVDSLNDIMIVHHVIEKSSLGPNNTILQDIHVIGDHYTFTTLPFDPNHLPPNNPHLPLRLTEDLAYRNRATSGKKMEVSYWKLVEPQTCIRLEDIKGRWYESRVLLPILHGQSAFALSYSKGEIGDVGSWMNGRGDCTSAVDKLSKPWMKKTNRTDAFGASVPRGTRIRGLIDHAAPVNLVPQHRAFPMDPALLAAQVNNVNIGIGGNGHGGHQQMGPGAMDTDMAEFVDVDQMDEGF